MSISYRDRDGKYNQVLVYCTDIHEYHEALVDNSGTFLWKDSRREMDMTHKKVVRNLPELLCELLERVKRLEEG